MDHLEGKRVLVTGAARGIGYHTAAQFARAGCEILLTDITREAVVLAAEKLRDETGAQVHSYAYDVSKQKAVEDNLARMQREVGEIDILVNNAGIGHSGELAETSLKVWKRLIDVNLMGPLFHVHALLPRMTARRSGHIVNISSGQAFFRLPTWGAYAAVKAALGVYSEVLHFELRKYGVAVTTVYPFMVNTGFYDGVEGETWGSRLSMKLVPYYSMRPETVARIIVKAVRRQQRVEKVSLLNDLGYYVNFVPLASGILARTANYLLAKRAAL